ncbi:5921_t:CDS:2 [Acaulospora colombiana]|uniref:5921_t:CDS:1 n=1 Tax=Acaulospora colombiana TaxID=27376 RepID=A0ACA9KK13_9GLOM|nr:5921_t:CDS:2 [Acaulospora colombiana]
MCKEFGHSTVDAFIENGILEYRVMDEIGVERNNEVEIPFVVPGSMMIFRAMNIP